MNRLPTLCLIVTAAMTSMRSGAAQDANFTVAGDVPSPGTYTFVAGEAADLSTLLERSGLTSERGNATIVRGPSRAIMSANLIQPERRPNRTPLNSGDIVIFRRLEAGQPSPEHVLIIDQGATRVVSLVNGAIPLGEVLASEGLPLTGRVSVVRIEWSRGELLSLSERDTIRHGDIISLESSGPQSGMRITETFQGMTIPVMQASVTNPEPVQSVVTEPELDLLTPNPSVLSVPPTPRSATLYVPDADSTYSESAGLIDAAIDGDIEEFAGSGQMELRTSDSAASTDDAAENSPLFHTASLGSQLPGSGDDTLNIQLSDNYKPAINNSSSNAIWNGIFVTGLLFAMGLIVVGWLKTRHEREMETQMAETMKVTGSADVAETPEVEQLNVEVAESPTSSETELPVESETSVEPTAELNIDDGCPVLSVGMESDDTADTELPESTASWQDVSEESAVAVVSSAASDTVSQEQGEWFAADWRPPEPKRSSEGDGKTKASSKHSDAAATDPLEDLIQNRLPINLEQTVFPLQIALFGKPAGPQRLRIDAAHTKIAAPHMASSARRSKRKKPATVAESSTEGEHNRQESATAGSSGDDSSRFDRALNFLEEQSEK